LIKLKNDINEKIKETIWNQEGATNFLNQKNVRGELVNGIIIDKVLQQVSTNQGSSIKNLNLQNNYEEKVEVLTKLLKKEKDENNQALSQKVKECIIQFVKQNEDAPPVYAFVNFNNGAGELFEGVWERLNRNLETTFDENKKV